MASTDMFMAIIRFKKVSTDELKSLQHLISRVPKQNYMRFLSFLSNIKIIIYSRKLNH